MHLCMCVHACAYVCVYMCAYVHMCVHACMSMHVHLFVHVHMHACTCVYMSMCVRERDFLVFLTCHSTGLKCAHVKVVQDAFNCLLHENYLLTEVICVHVLH